MGKLLTSSWALPSHLRPFFFLFFFLDQVWYCSIFSVLFFCGCEGACSQLNCLYFFLGLTFLLNETEAITLLMCSLQDEKHTSTTECLTLRQAAVFLSKGFFCRPQDVRMIAELHLRVVSSTYLMNVAMRMC